MSSELHKAAGEVSPPSRSLTSPAKPRRSVCAPGSMASSFYRRPALERRKIMWFSSWLGKWQRSARGGRSHGLPHKRPTCRPQLEALEERTVPSGGHVFKTIDDPNAAYNGPFQPGTDANGINARGQIVGDYADANGGNHGFLLGGGHYTTLDDPNAINSPGTLAHGINDRGQIVGQYVDANSLTHGFLLSGGQYTNLDDPSGRVTAAYGINSRGDIVGFYDDASANEHGFLLSDGRYTTIDDPNGVGQTDALGINDRGQIVGLYRDASGSFHGFLLSEGRYTTLDGPNAVATNANGINSRGDIVGFYNDGSAVHAFLLSHGQYTTLDDPEAVITIATGINARGQIVGTYYDNTIAQAHGFLATKAHGDDGHGDDAPAGASQAAGRASGDNADRLLPTAALANATLMANQVSNVAGSSWANHSDGLSGISTGTTGAAATVPSTLPGSGDSGGGCVDVVSVAGTDNGLTGNEVFARNDEVFRFDL
jgi:probable HAF family extracellular repeat protein